MKKILLFAITTLMCCSLYAVTLPEGMWRGNLSLNDSVHLPVLFYLEQSAGGDYHMSFYNHGERLLSDKIIVKGDSVKWSMPVFDNEFRCVLKGEMLKGVWVNKMRKDKNVIPFKAVLKNSEADTAEMILRGEEQFIPGRWKTTFSPGTADSSNAITIFPQQGSEGDIEGTILTETGDYRYLGGYFYPDSSFFVSTFDGSHAFVFWARKIGNKYYGDFYSGLHWHEKFVMERDDKFRLRDPWKLTYISDSSRVGFTFNDLRGNPVSLSDPQFKGKVVIVTVMGTWCPNCMDETKELVELYNTYHEQGLEIVALAYERTTDTAIANANIRRVRKKFGADYTFLLTGKNGNAKSASESLPFLNNIMSFPTTIYIGRNGKVAAVYTGYNGPATHDVYVNDKEATEILIQKLLSEK